MTVNKFWISPALGVHENGPWWEALFNLLALTLLISSLVFYLPYQVGLCVFDLIGLLCESIPRNYLVFCLVDSMRFIHDG